MLMDKQHSVIKRAVAYILQCRAKKVRKGVRKFDIPKLNFNAQSYVELEQNNNNRAFTNKKPEL